MKTDLYTKAVLTVIALSLTVVAIQLSVKDVNAQAYNRASGVQLVAICNPDGKNCADVTPDFHLKGQVKDLERLPAEISSQIAGRIGGPISNQINQQMNRISGQVSELQVKIDQIAQRR